MSSASNPAQAVDAYIAKAPVFARPICEKLRALLRRAAPELRESIKWGHPWYVGHGLVCGFAACKQHVRLHFFRGAELPDPDGLLASGEGDAAGNGMKLTSVAELSPKSLERLLRAAVDRDARAEATPAPRARRPELPMPGDLAEALQGAPKARAYFETLPPSARRDFIEWITTAKRAATRTRRLEEAIAMLAEGRRRNEQYR